MTRIHGQNHILISGSMECREQLGLVNPDRHTVSRCVIIQVVEIVHRPVQKIHVLESDALLTSANEDYLADKILTGIDVKVVESEHTATFANYYDSGNRTQVLLASGSRIPQAAVPAEWTQPDILYVGPLLHELPTDCVNWFEPKKLSCLVPSGWLRRRGPDGAINHADTLPPFAT